VRFLIFRKNGSKAKQLGILLLITVVGLAVGYCFYRFGSLNPSTIKRKLAHDYYSLGCSHVTRKDYDRSIGNFNKAIELKSDYAKAYYGRGWVYERKKDYMRAVEDYSKAIKFSPGYTEAYVARGYVYENMGSYEKASSDYDKAIQLQPNYAKPYRGRAYMFLVSGDHDKAIKNYTKAIQLSPGTGYHYCNRGYAHWITGDYKKAVEDCGKAIELKHRCVICYANLGRIYLYGKAFDRALQNFESAMGIDPHDKYVAIWIYITTVRSGGDGEAGITSFANKHMKDDQWITPVIQLFLGRLSPDECIEAAEQSDPKTEKEQKCEAYFYVGQYYLLQKKQQKAKYYFQKCLDTGLKHFVEYAAAKMELELMGNTVVDQGRTIST